MTVRFPQQGIFAALAIPTDADGRLRKTALSAHIAWLKTRGIHGILALGSTGEFLQFGPEERKEILAVIAELAAPLPVIAHISDLNPHVAADLGKFARRLGLPGVALMPPHFYPASDDEQLAHFLYIADATQLPVLLYNFPERTGNRIALETIADFAERAPLAGIKQSGAEFEYHRALIALGQECGFPVFSGADTRLPEAFALGAAGCIGGLANFVPEDMVTLFRICREKQPGDPEPARARLCEVGEWLGRMTFPRNVAAGIEARGGDPGIPKMIVSPDSEARYQEIVAGLRACFAAWNLPSIRDTTRAG